MAARSYHQRDCNNIAGQVFKLVRGAECNLGDGPGLVISSGWIICDQPWTAGFVMVGITAKESQLWASFPDPERRLPAKQYLSISTWGTWQGIHSIRNDKPERIFCFINNHH